MKKQLKSEIISIGTELLLGQITDTNAQWLSEQLALHGIDTYYHTVVGDNLTRVEDVFKKAQSRSDVIIVTGGLGPTDDDMTREAFQSMTRMEMVEHSPSMKKIKDFFKAQQTKITPNNSKQARIFENSYVIINKVGMAPGMIVTYQSKTWVFLPGVPTEMKEMAETDVFPYLIQLSGEEMVIKSTTLRFIGIGEADLEDRLARIIHSQTNPTIAPLAQKDGVVIRLTTKETSQEKADQRIEQTKQQILKKVGKHFFGVDDETIEEKVFAMLKEQNKRIAAAESITGGKFTSKLISFDGASNVCPGGIVCYDSDVKKNVLHVSTNTIEEKGVVSPECAVEMATNVCRVLDSDLGISFTGVAGPGKLDESPVGTVYIAVHHPAGEPIVEKFTFQGNRKKIRHRATLKGFELLFNLLKSAN